MLKYVLMIIGGLFLGYVGLVNGVLYYEWEAGPIAAILGSSSGAEVADPGRFYLEQATCLLLGLAIGGTGYYAACSERAV